MEYLSGALGIFGAAIDGISSAFKNLGQLGNTDLGKLVIELTGDLTDNAKTEFNKGMKDAGKKGLEGALEHSAAGVPYHLYKKYFGK